MKNSKKMLLGAAVFAGILISCPAVSNAEVNTNGIVINDSKVPVTGVTITPHNLRMEEHAYYRLTATVAPENATNKDVVWETSNYKVASITADGIVVANEPGDAIITAITKDGNKVATSNVLVVPQHISVKSISLPESVSLEVNQESTLTPVIQPVYATNKNVSWKSSDAKTVSVSSKGVIKGLQAGTATITATTEDGQKVATTTVTIAPKYVPVSGITLDIDEFSMDEHSTTFLYEKIEPANATNKKVKWTSNAPEIASVGFDGLVTALKPGVAIITATTEDGNKTATCKVTIEPVSISSSKYRFNISGYSNFAELNVDLTKDNAELVILGGRLFPINVSNINNNMEGASIKIVDKNGATKLDKSYQLKTLYSRSVENVKLSVNDVITIRNGSYSLAGLQDLLTGQMLTSKAENSFSYKVTASGLQKH